MRATRKPAWAAPKPKSASRNQTGQLHARAASPKMGLVEESFMPSRGGVCAILLMFFGAVGWQLYSHFSAPYTMTPKLIDSLRLAVDDGQTTWRIFHNGMPLGRAVNEVREDRSVGYILRQSVTLDGNLTQFLNLGAINRLFQLNLDENLALTMNSDMQVTQFGSLTRFTMNAAVHLDKRIKDGLIRAFISGRAEEGCLILSGYFTVAEQKYPLPPDLRIRHDQKNLFMSSLAPADCLPYLVAGQTWETPVLDLGELMRTSLAGELGLPAQKTAVVRVREEPAWYDWQGEPSSCWMVESKQRGLTMTLWVRQSDGRVLRQQAKWGDSAVELIRQRPAAPGFKPKEEAASRGAAKP
jgi:hypothetical protein